MAEKFTFDPEGCYAKPSALPLPDWALDRLIGRSEHARILMGALPFFDDEGISWQFMLAGMYPPGVRPSRAFLFTGPEGCGKRALNLAFLDRLYEDYQKQEAELRYYEFPLHIIKGTTKSESLQRLDAVMSAIQTMCLKPEYEEICLYLSFGDLRPILKKRQLAERFAYWIRRLPSDETHMSVTTGWCHREPAALPECIQRGFHVLYLSLPTKEDRSSFFTLMMKPYPKLAFEMQPDDLAEKTEGFTFRMLNEASEMFYAWIMTGLQEAQLQPGDYISGLAQDVFVIPEQVCEMILENIRSKQMIRKQKGQFAPAAMAMPVQMPVQTAIPAAGEVSVQQQAAAPPAPQQNDSGDGDGRKGIAEKLNTHTDLINFADSMRPIAILQVITSENNADPEAPPIDEEENEPEAEAPERIPASQS